MRFKLTFVLLLANLVVFFALWRLSQPPVVPPKAGGAIPKDFAPNHIVIEDKNHPENSRELVENSNGVWRLVKPVNWLANEFAVTNIISKLQFPDEKTNFPVADLEKSGQTLKDFGLDKPVMEVTLSYEEPKGGVKKHTLFIGSGTLYGNNLNVMNPKDGLVRVVGRDLLDSLSGNLDDLRDSKIFTLSPVVTQSLSVTISAAGGGTAALTRFVRNGDQWRLDTPFTSAADGDKINAVITQLDGLRATTFLAGNEAAAGNASLATPPTMKVELKEGDTSQTLWLGGKIQTEGGGQYYARFDDSPTTIFTVKEGPLFETLRDAQAALREHQFLAFAPEKVSTITVRFFNVELRLQKLEDGRWQISDKGADIVPTRIVADLGVVQTMLDNLRELTAKNFASDAPTAEDLQNYGLASPQWVVTLQGDKTVVLDIGLNSKTSPVHWYARVEGTDSVYEIDPEILSQLSIEPLKYRDRTLAVQPAGTQVVSLKLTHLTGDDLTTGDEILNFTVDPAKTTWDEFLRDKPQLVRGSLPLLLSWVRNCTVEKYRKATFDEHYQMGIGSPVPVAVPWRYRLDAGVQVGTASPQILTFFFSDRQGRAQLGGTRDAPLPTAIFDLPANIIGALGAVTHDVIQPAEAVQAIKEMDLPINPRATPAPTPRPAPAGASATSPPPAPVAPAAP